MATAANPAAGAGPSGSGSSYVLRPIPYHAEDIVFCVDVGPESSTLMRADSGPKWALPMTRLDSIKQAILLFVSSKLNINPDHRFSFCSIADSLVWPQKQFTNEVKSAVAQVEALTAAETSCGKADLTLFFRLAANEAKASKKVDRILRVVLIYCRSSTLPEYSWPVTPKNFTLDVIYLHDKPNSENCPQEVYDCLIDASEYVSEYESYVFESAQGLNSVLIRYICTLLCHPEQRCLQDDLDIPKLLTRNQLAQTDDTESDDITW